jgi:hypothetical protein
MSKVFPSILPGQAFVDERYTERELARMEWRELRSIAASHPSEEVNGSMSRDEMEAALVGARRV